MQTRISSKAGKRTARNTVICLVAIFLFFLLLDLGISWLFISRILHPACIDPIPYSESLKFEEHWLTTKDGIKIRVWYFPSRNGAAIIVFGGLNGALGIREFPIETIIREKYGVLLVDSRSCALPRTTVTLGADEIFDGEAALEFISKRPEVNDKAVGVMGYSFGGTTAIRLAANNPEIQAIVRDGGYANLGELFTSDESSSFISKVILIPFNFIFELQTGIQPWTISPIDDIRSISPRPVFLIYGEHEIVDGMAQYRMANAPKEIWVVPGGSHGNNYATAKNEYINKVITYFDEYLIAANIQE